VSAGSPLRVQRDGPLAIATISAPPLNLYDGAMRAALEAMVADVAADPPRALLLRAEGSVVSGGVDVHLFDGLEPADAAMLWEEGLVLVHRLEALPCPTVFAAHALCLTWALEIALACDLLVAAEGARFGLVEAVVGLTPAMGGTQRLAERAGAARARELVMSGRLYDAGTLAAWGVVNQVWPEDGFAQRAEDYARRLAAGPTRAHAATKRIVAAQGSGGVRAADALVPQVAGGLFATEDLRNAVRSFLEQGPGHAVHEGR